MRTWSNDEILRSTNSNSIVMDLLLVGDTYGCDGDSTTNYDRRRSQIILSQKQYKDRLKDSYRSSFQIENMPSIEEGAALVQIHPVYEVNIKHKIWKNIGFPNNVLKTKSSSEITYSYLLSIGDPWSRTDYKNVRIRKEQQEEIKTDCEVSEKHKRSSTSWISYSYLPNNVKNGCSKIWKIIHENVFNDCNKRLCDRLHLK